RFHGSIATSLSAQYPATRAGAICTPAGPSFRSDTPYSARPTTRFAEAGRTRKQESTAWLATSQRSHNTVRHAPRCEKHGAAYTGTWQAHGRWHAPRPRLYRPIPQRTGRTEELAASRIDLAGNPARCLA